MSMKREEELSLEISYLQNLLFSGTNATSCLRNQFWYPEILVLDKNIQLISLSEYHFE